MPVTSNARQGTDLVEHAQAATGSGALESSFREIIDLLPAAIYTTDARGRLTHFNAACELFSGRTPELGTDHWCVTWKLFYPDGTPMPHDECPMAVALKEGRAVHGEQAIAERPDGTRIWFEPYPVPLRDAHGRIVGGINMLVDITERKQNETERSRLLAREREARSEAEALNEVARAVSGLDLESVVQKATDAATALTGAKFGAFFYNVTDEKGESYVLYTLSGAPREAFEKFGLPRNTPIFAPTFRGEGIVRIADVLADPRYGKNPPHRGMPPGHLPVRSYLAVPVVSSSGEVLGGLFFAHPEIDVFTEQSERVALGIATHAAIAIDNARLFNDAQREIAERKRIEEALRESEKLLMDADRRKDEFLATLAHELRNPLAPIRNSVQIMRLSGIDGEVAEQARETIERQVTHLVRLVDDLLDVSRISSNKFELRRERVALAVIVQSAVETSRPLIEASGQEFTVALPPRTVWVNADLTRIAQAVANLLNNAAKYTPESGRIRLSAERQGKDAVVRVRDTGIGIPQEMLPHIFEMFRQVDTSQERSVGGLGIGLTLVKNLVEMHGGTVEVHSDGVGRGSEFVLRLPVAKDKAKRSSDRLPCDQSPVDPRRILVVDDNRDSAESLAMLLKHSGHQTRTAHDGHEAMEAAAAFRPDVILLDIGMPKLNGYEVARRIREQPWGAGIVLVALTGWGQEEDRARSREAGFDDHFVKPVEHAALTRLLAGLPPAPGIAR